VPELRGLGFSKTANEARKGRSWEPAHEAEASGPQLARERPGDLNHRSNAAAVR
jgi:hypothetical protein